MAGVGYGGRLLERRAGKAEKVGREGGGPVSFVLLNLPSRPFGVWTSDMFLRFFMVVWFASRAGYPEWEQEIMLRIPYRVHITHNEERTGNSELRAP